MQYKLQQVLEQCGICTSFFQIIIKNKIHTNIQIFKEKFDIVRIFYF